MSDVLLLHAGIADTRMWEPQLGPLGREHRVIAFDLPGFGSVALEPGRLSYVDYVAERLEAPAAVVCCSFGASIGLELAVTRPELVEQLVLIGSGLAGWDWSEGAQAGFAEEEGALERGDLVGAAAAQARMWLADDADEAVVELVREMTVRSYQLQLPVENKVEVVWPEPRAAARLGDVRCPTLVVVGDRDVPDLLEIANVLKTSVPGARKAVIEGSGHLPSLERPNELNRLLLEFLR
jgi:pimeloyl-ACP methyl ester carboxylesterase